MCRRFSQKRHAHHPFPSLQYSMINFDITHCHCIHNYKTKVDDNFRTSFIWSMLPVFMRASVLVRATKIQLGLVCVLCAVSDAGKKLLIPFIMKLCCKIKSFSQYTRCWKWWMNWDPFIYLYIVWWMNRQLNLLRFIFCLFHFVSVVRIERFVFRVNEMKLVWYHHTIPYFPSVIAERKKHGF